MHRPLRTIRLALRTTVLSAALAMLPGLASVEEAERDPRSYGVVIAADTLRAEPAGDGAAVAELPAGTEVNIEGRRGLWMDVRSGKDAQRGWLRLTSVRLGVTAAELDLSDAGEAVDGKTKKRSFFSGVSRSVSSFFSRSQARARPQATTATIGIRGLTPADLQAAQADPKALQTMQGYAASAGDAAVFAREGDLAVRTVSYSVLEVEDE